MDNNIVLAVPATTLNMVYSDRDAGSLRRATGRSPSLPLELNIKSTPYVDNVTKVAGRRTVIRFDEKVVVDAVGTIATLSAYVVYAVPQGNVDLGPKIYDLSTRMTCLLGNALPAGDQLNKVSAIVMVGEQ